MSKPFRAVAVAIGIAASFVAAPGGQLSGAEAMISGLVVDALTGRPIGHADVYATLDRLVGNTTRAVTDAAGAFSIAPPAGFVDLWAAKQREYSDGFFGQRSPHGAGARVVVGAGQTRKDVVIRIWPMGVITGRVVDESGAPMPAVDVQALRESHDFDGTGWVTTGAPRSTSDRNGRFTLSPVRPGVYVVAVVSSDVGFRSPYGSLALGTYETTYFPGVASVHDATRVTMEPAGTIEMGDLRVPPRRADAVAVRGSLLGYLPAEWEVELLPVSTDTWSALDVKRTIVTSNAVFAFPAVPRGRYLVRARGLVGWSNTLPLGGGRMWIPPSPTAPRRDEPVAKVFWAQTEIVVGDTPLPPLALQVTPGQRIRGTLEFDGAGPRPSAEVILSSVMFVMRADGRDLRRVPTTTYTDAGGFVTPSHPSGTYALRTHRMDGWRPESVSIAGARVDDGRVELGNGDLQAVTIRMINRVAALEGRVQAAAGTREAGTVIVFSVDRRMWMNYANPDGRVQATLGDAEGRYRVPGLLPGEYFVASIAGNLPYNWRSAGYLSSRIPGATRVMLSQEAMTLNLAARK